MKALCLEKVLTNPPAANVDIHPERAEAISRNRKRWVKKSEITYWMDSYVDAPLVSKAFAEWNKHADSLQIVQTANQEDAKIRVTFDHNDGSWSYVGTDCLQVDTTQATMNFGWPLKYDYDTALHEVGHGLAFEHEHQNPNSGIDWNVPALNRWLSRSPNFWPPATVYRQIVAKSVGDGTRHDVDSIMHYGFPGGVIFKPEIYQTRPLIPKPGLSALDKETAKLWYGKTKETEYPESVGETDGEPITIVGNRETVKWVNLDRGDYTITINGLDYIVLVVFQRVLGGYKQIAAANGRNKTVTADVSLDQRRDIAIVARLHYTKTQEPLTGSLEVTKKW